jgi:hypothetical protein
VAETGSIADRDRFAGRPSGIRRTPARVHGIGRLFDRHAMLCTNPKAPLVAGLGRVGGVTALGSPIGAGSVLNGLTGIALALFAIWRGWPRRPGSLAAVGFSGFAMRPTAFALGALAAAGDCGAGSGSGAGSCTG